MNIICQPFPPDEQVVEAILKWLGVISEDSSEPEKIKFILIGKILLGLLFYAFYLIISGYFFKTQ